MIVFNKGRQKSFRTKAGLLAIPTGQSEQPDTSEMIRCVASNSDLSLFKPEAEVKEEAPKKEKKKGKAQKQKNKKPENEQVKEVVKEEEKSEEEN